MLGPSAAIEHLSVHQPPACNVDRGAGDPRGTFRGEKECGGRNVSRSSKPGNRVQGSNLRSFLFWHMQRRAFGENSGRREAVGGNIEAANLPCHMSGQHDHAGPGSSATVSSTWLVC